MNHNYSLGNLRVQVPNTLAYKASSSTYQQDKSWPDSLAKKQVKPFVFSAFSSTDWCSLWPVFWKAL